MSQNKLRLSRGLVVFVGLTLVVGLIVYARSKMDGEQANAQPTPPQPAPAPVSPPAAHDGAAIPQYLVTMTPATRPASDVPATAPAHQLVAAVLPPVAPPASANPLADAAAKIDASDFLAARRILNDAMLAGGLSGDDVATARHLMTEANQQLVFSPRKFADDALAAGYAVQPGDRADAIAAKFDLTGAFLCRINGISNPRKLRAGATLKAIKGPFHAVITKSKFTLDLYLGAPGGKDSTYVCTYPVGLGKDNCTPTGTWAVEPGKKLPNPKFWGAGDIPPMESGDPKNPLGKFWIGLIGTEGNALGQQSYGIHGTIDDTSIGKQASLGCIRMHNEDVAVVFEMLVEGKSTVVVKD